MGRTIGVSEMPYRSIVEALNNITKELIIINRSLTQSNIYANQTRFLLDGITRKINKRWYKKNFGIKKPVVRLKK